MKIIARIFQIFVGILFIFSGLVKLNDPLGFSYKLDEYFSAAVLGLEFLQPLALPIAIFVVIFEVVIGVMLLLGFQKKFTAWSLLLMIVFFTFLTFYSAYFNKVTDCGCFGDAIPLTPWESFTKDVILLIMIIVLFMKQDYWYSAFAKAKSSIITLLATIGCFALAYYVLMHLPVLDFRAYKVGTNMVEAMKEDPTRPDVYEYKWYFNVDGAEKVVTTNGDYPSGYGELVRYETELVEKGYEPPIHDFKIEDENGEDFTSDFLTKPKVAMIITYNLNKAEVEGLNKLNKFIDRAETAGYEVIGLTASSMDDVKTVMNKHEFSTTFYTADETALKTIVRSVPGVILVDRGIITAKSHWNDLESLEL